MKGQGKVDPRLGHKGTEREYKFSSALPLTSALDGGGWSTPPLAAVPPGKTRYPLYSRLGGPHDRSGRIRSISHPTAIRSPNFQPAGSRYT